MGRGGPDYTPPPLMRYSPPRPAPPRPDIAVSQGGGILRTSSSSSRALAAHWHAISGVTGQSGCAPAPPPEPASCLVGVRGGSRRCSGGSCACEGGGQGPVVFAWRPPLLLLLLPLLPAACTMSCSSSHTVSGSRRASASSRLDADSVCAGGGGGLCRNGRVTWGGEGTRV